jgi:RNA polymerase sigma-70 factor (ECF subfamily)
MEERLGNVHLLFAVFMLAVLETWPDDSALADSALMERILQRDAQALEALYDRYARPLYSLALRISQQPTTAEEIVQDVFMQLWNNANQYQSTRGPLLPWLFTIARNRSLDLLRLKREKQRRREDSANFDLPPTMLIAPDAEGAFDLAKQSEKIRTLMASLPEAQRHAIELAFFEGMSHSEISSSMGQPLGTVKSWIRNGLSTLRESLEGARS